MAPHDTRLAYQEPILDTSLLLIYTSFGGNTQPHPWCDLLHTGFRIDAVELWCRDYQTSNLISVRNGDHERNQ